MQTSDSRKRQAEAADVEALAEELCRYDDSLHHMEATDDFPCWHCKAKARAVLASDWLAADRVRVWEEALRWVRAQADVTSPEYVIDRIDRAEPFNPYRVARGGDQ